MKSKVELSYKIEEIYKTSYTFRTFINRKYESSYVNNVVSEVNDFLLERDGVYKLNNFIDNFYKELIIMENHSLKLLLRDIINRCPKSNEKYEMVFDKSIKNVSDIYDVGVNVLRKSRQELEKLAEDSLQEGNIKMMINIRKYLVENFKIVGFSSFIKEDKMMALKMLKDSGKTIEDRAYVRLQSITKDNPGYLGLLCKFHYKEGISINRINELYTKLINLRSILHELPGQPYEYETFESLDDDLTELKRLHIAKLLSDDYVGPMKRVRSNPTFVELANKFSNMVKNNSEVRDFYDSFFLPKVSKYHTQKDLIDAFEAFMEYIDKNDEPIQKKVNDDYYSDIVYQSHNFIVVRARSCESVDLLAGDTSWCLRNSINYWKDYVSGDYDQFLIIYDLSKKQSNINSIIGVTMNQTLGWDFNTAHLKNDAYIGEDAVNYILSKDGIDLDKLCVLGAKFGSNKEYESGTDEYGSTTWDNN